ncbi:unnamed protein product, partial [Rotaria sp. Silwood2]
MDSNLKGAIFERANLTNVNFSGANLYKADFTHSNIMDNQLENAVSIQDAKQQNGVPVHDKNLMKDGRTNCNTSLVSSWIERNESFTK